MVISHLNRWGRQCRQCKNYNLKWKNDINSGKCNLWVENVENWVQYYSLIHKLCYVSFVEKKRMMSNSDLWWCYWS